MPADLLFFFLSLISKPIVDFAGNKIGKWYERSAKHREAVEAITSAVKNTDDYLQWLQSGAERKKAREQELAIDWDITGRTLGDAAENADEKKLAEKLRKLKKAYWENYDDWSDEEIEEVGLNLSTIREKLERYIEISEQQPK